MTKFVFQRNATNDRDIVHAPTFNLAVEQYLDIRRDQINAASETKKVNRIWVEKNAEGGYTCISVDGKDDGYRFAIKAAYYTPSAPAASRSALDKNGHFRGSTWLTREMDREDSDY